jgi:hypothetical protein
MNLRNALIEAFAGTRSKFSSFIDSPIRHWTIDDLSIGLAKIGLGGGFRLFIPLN